MSELVWDRIGERRYETGVDHGVLYIPDPGGAYANGVAWNGLVSVSENPTGAEPNALYADNIKYLNLFSAEEFGATVEAFTFPDEFAQFDGIATLEPGVMIGQQHRKIFGLSYRTKVGNDIDNDDHGYKLHLVYGCQASPSERAYNTMNESPDAITFSWEVTTTPVAVEGHKNTAILTVDSTVADPTALGILEDFLYGTAGTDPSLPLPDAVAALFTGTAISVTPDEPAYDDVDTITIPVVAGVTYYRNGIALPSGDLVITSNTVITARPNPGYYFPANVDDDWLYEV